MGSTYGTGFGRLIVVWPPCFFRPCAWFLPLAIGPQNHDFSRLYMVNYNHILYILEGINLSFLEFLGPMVTGSSQVPRFAPPNLHVRWHRREKQRLLTELQRFDVNEVGRQDMTLQNGWFRMRWWKLYMNWRVKYHQRYFYGTFQWVVRQWVFRQGRTR